MLDFAKYNIFLRPEEAMFVALVKACLPEKKYSAFEKIEPSSALKILANRMRNLHLHGLSFLSSLINVWFMLTPYLT